MSHAADMQPKHVVALKKQLAAINRRLLALESERRQLKEALLSLRGSLQRLESGRTAARRTPAQQPRRPPP
jgi:hypothetical protein